MSGDSNFLSRWSRLKRGAERKWPADPAPHSGVKGAGNLDVPSTTQIAGNDSPLVAELPPEELAKLPSIEDFTVETDLAPFLRQGIPSGLRNAALRKMWALDPAIRDRVGDALDYAYDWNSPGGVPGAGPLLATDDVQAMLRSIAGGAEAEPSNAAKTEEVSGTIAEASPAEPHLSSNPPARKAVATSEAGNVPAPTSMADPDSPDRAATSAELRPAKQEAVAQARRHGGAKPF
jgi:hypothetical protein